MLSTEYSRALGLIAFNFMIMIKKLINDDLNGSQHAKKVEMNVIFSKQLLHL